ncbi:NADPH-dependent F420 reductase [Aeromicrobium sp. CFBP 8757]|uniref:NADPH-dependent F420 reductase n=1 Tax=Aeromicrobium sp. CFBP 8757 TaxID=2775288 RepID=UPI00177ED437|nr:NADPH-dependent F420 reductase [Aeromicrobium sp. CFBP 8757]
MKYAIVGAGNIGSALARRFAASEISVGVSNSRGPESLSELTQQYAPWVEPVTTEQALQADVVILAVLFDSVEEVTHQVTWDGRVVVDATNAVDLPSFRPRDLGGRASTHLVAEAVPGARVVKAFNTLAASNLADEPVVGSGRRVLFVSGDDSDARDDVVALVESLGFAAVDLGTIGGGGRAQEFGGALAAKDFVRLD